jgi:DNA-directed RNA polymerase specialized sigma24 family protein
MDTELVVQAQHGDEEAFASLAVAVGGRLHAVAHRILRDLDLAEDATQQALLSIWRDLPQLRDESDRWTDDSSVAVADRDQLERAFRRLSVEHRAVVVLHHYLDLPLPAVAEALGIPPGTARSRLHHAMRGLRAALDADARPTSREVAQ